MWLFVNLRMEGSSDLDYVFLFVLACIINMEAWWLKGCVPSRGHIFTEVGRSGCPSLFFLFTGQLHRTPDPLYLRVYISGCTKRGCVLKRLTDDSDSVGQKVTTGNLVETTQVSKSRSTDLAAVRALAAITDQEHSHLTLGGLDGRVGLTRGNGVTLGEEQEVVDKSFHVLLHGGTGRG